MNPEVKVQWVNALRSPDYKQGRNKLVQVNDKGERLYCCLGVLCELAVDAGTAIRMDGSQGYSGTARGNHDSNNGVPPYTVAQWAGFPATDYNVVTNPVVPGLVINGNTVTVAELNDEYNYTFSEIADIVERYM